MKVTEFLTEKPVQSTWITNLTYNRPNKKLTMMLSNGRVFLIPNINRRTFDRWTTSPSKGQFFHNFIKDKYVITRIR